VNLEASKQAGSLMASGGTNGGHNRFFQAISAPQIICIGQDAIHLFLKKREIYLRLVNEAHEDLTPATLVSSVDPDLPENAVIVGLFQSSIKDVSEVTDEILMTYLKSTQDTSALLNAEDCLLGSRRR
jgi:hypothetical protein